MYQVHKKKDGIDEDWADAGMGSFPTLEIAAGVMAVSMKANPNLYHRVVYAYDDMLFSEVIEVAPFSDVFFDVAPESKMDWLSREADRLAIERLRRERDEAVQWLCKIQRLQGWSDLGLWLEKRGIEWESMEDEKA